MEINETELKNLINNDFSNPLYIPNNGNAGDSLIAQGTFDFFDNNDIDFEIGSVGGSYDKNLIYAGGGNLVGYYHDCENWIKRNKNKNILLLPHTVQKVDSLLKSLSDNVTIICREWESYDYVKSFNTVRTFLHQDMALYINLDIENKEGEGVGNFFRNDAEKTSIKIPLGNNDISRTYMHPRCTRNRKNVKETTIKFLDHINKYKTINTNRLHVGIGGHLLGKEVNLHSNSYWKNEEVCKYSLSQSVNFNK